MERKKKTQKATKRRKVGKNETEKKRTKAKNVKRRKRDDHPIEESPLEKLASAHQLAQKALDEDCNFFLAIDRWGSFITDANFRLRQLHHDEGEVEGDGEEERQIHRMLAEALEGKWKANMVLHRFDQAAEAARQLVTFVGEDQVGCHILLSKALFRSAQHEESLINFGRPRWQDRQRHLALYQQAYDCLHHAMQLHPNDEDLKREAEAIKPHLVWLTALPDELCARVFSFLSKSELHYVSRACRDWYRLASDDAIWRPFAYELDPQLDPPEESETEYAWKKKYRELYGMLVELPDQLARAFQDLVKNATIQSQAYWYLYDMDTHVEEGEGGGTAQSTPPPVVAAPPVPVQAEEEDTSSDSDDEPRLRAHPGLQPKPRTLKQQLGSKINWFYGDLIELDSSQAKRELLSSVNSMHPNSTSEENSDWVEWLWGMLPESSRFFQTRNYRFTLSIWAVVIPAHAVVLSYSAKEMTGMPG